MSNVKHQILVKTKGKMLVLLMIVKMKTKIKRRGNDIDDILKNRLRYSLTLATRARSNEPLFALRDFLLVTCGNS